ncbi:glycosyltransferase [Clostridiaceae bacterium]|nr:glycosyltransferase [Clostridiaceae bacterium]
MNIAFILPHIAFTPGGGFKIVFEYSNYLSAKGYDITIYFMTDHLWKRRIPVQSLRRKLGRFLSAQGPGWFLLNENIICKALFDIKDVSAHDVIVATAVRTAIMLNRLQDRSVEKIYFIQGFETFYADEEILFQSYAFPMKKIVVSKWLKDIVQEYTDEPVTVVPNGINLDIFQCTRPIEDRKRHTIAFHYRREEGKGSKYAIEGIRALKEAYPDLEVFAVGVEGRPKELPLFCKYYRKIEQKQVAWINNQALVFMCTSIEEGFGLPGLEAMACGCVLVTSDFAGGREYAVHDVNALVSEPGTTAAMVRHIIRLFQDEALVKRLSLQGIATARTFRFEDSAKKIEQAVTRNS